MGGSRRCPRACACSSPPARAVPGPRVLVDLLVATLPDVADPNVTVGGRTTNATGCGARARGRSRPVLPTYGSCSGCRTRRRARVHVDAEDLAEEGVQALGAVPRVAGAAAVAGPDVQEAVLPNAIIPPLWLEYGSRIVRRPRPPTVASPFEDERYSTMRSSPARSV